MFIFFCFRLLFQHGGKFMLNLSQAGWRIGNRHGCAAMHLLNCYCILPWSNKEISFYTLHRFFSHLICSFWLDFEWYFFFTEITMNNVGHGSQFIDTMWQVRFVRISINKRYVIIIMIKKIWREKHAYGLFITWIKIWIFFFKGWKI